jgi:hypothetical protein
MLVGLVCVKWALRRARVIVAYTNDYIHPVLRDDEATML